MKQSAQNNLVPFFLGFLVSFFLLGGGVLFYYENYIKANIGTETIIVQPQTGEVDFDGVERNTLALAEYQTNTSILSSICEYDTNSGIDNLTQTEYEEFLLYSLQSNPGGNNVFFLVNDLEACGKLYEDGMISEARFFECKIKQSIDNLVNNIPLEASILADILLASPEFQIVADSFTSRQCEDMSPISSSLVNYCQDTDIFNDFKREQFTENRNQLCQE